MDQRPDEDDAVLVLLPLPADPLFVDAVDEAVAGEVEEMPHAQPSRPVGVSSSDFASVYIRHRASFALHARRFLNDARDVDEVLQEAFLRLFLAMPELETELQALAYCRRTVTNLCIDRYRRSKREKSFRFVSDDAVAPMLTSSDDPAADAIRRERTKMLFAALSEIPEDLAEILVLRDLDGLAYEEIGRALELPDGTVKSRLFRARAEVARKIRERHESRGPGAFASVAIAAGAFL